MAYMYTQNGTSDITSGAGAGQVGIGISSTSEKLHLATGSGNCKIRIDSYYSTAGGGPVLQFLKSSNNTVGSKSTTANNELIGRLEFYGVNANGTPDWAKGARIDSFQDGNAGSTYVPGRIEFLTGTNSSDLGTRMVIKNDGKIGIGTGIPSENLEVAGSARIGSGAYNSGHLLIGNYHLWIDVSDRLRIKSSAPTSDTDGVVVGSQS